MNTGPTPASAAGFLRWAGFVLINDCIPHADAECALCCGKIEKGYVREAQTRLFYRATRCFAGHAIAIKKRARKVS